MCPKFTNHLKEGGQNLAELPKVKLTAKQEKFCQKYIELSNASEAYRQSYDADSMNSKTVNRKAKELMDSDKVKVRIEQLQAEHKKRHNLTVDDLLLELEEARAMALTCETPQASAAISATMGKAKLLGLDKQVLDITSGGKPIKAGLGHFYGEAETDT